MALVSGVPEQALGSVNFVSSLTLLGHPGWCRACQHTGRPRIIGTYKECRSERKRARARRLWLGLKYTKAFIIFVYEYNVYVQGLPSVKMN